MPTSIGLFIVLLFAVKFISFVHSSTVVAERGCRHPGYMCAMATSLESQRHVLIKLNNNNYHQWKFSAEMVLLKEDLWDTVAEDPPAIITPAWKKKDGSARGTIALSIEPNLHTLVKDCMTAKSMWLKVKNHFEKVSFTSKVFIKRRLLATKLENSTNMEAFITQVTEYINRLRVAGDKIDDLEIVSTLLCGLPDDYDGLIMGLETRDDSSLTLEYVQEKLMDEFNRRQEKAYPQQQVMLTMDKRGPQRMGDRRCFECNRVGHLRNRCPELRKYNDSAYQGKERSYYMERNTNIDKSMANSNEERYRPRQPSVRDETGYFGKFKQFHDSYENTPDGAKLTSDKCQIPEQAECSETFYSYVSMDLTKINASCESQQWVLDSGATVHMCGNREKLMDYKEFQTSREVMFANGTKARALGYGNASITSNIDQMLLTGVIYVPDLKVNLMSVPVLDQEGYRVVFENSVCTVSFGNNSYLSGVLNGGIYVLSPNEEALDKALSACVHVWHSRLGHRNIESIVGMSKSEEVKNLNITPCKHSNYCNACQRGNMIQSSFHTVDHLQSSKPFFLIHADLCGPIKPMSAGGGQYFLTLTDDFSRYSYLKVISQKSQAAQAIIDYLNHHHNKFGYFPAHFRSDGGREFENQLLNDFLTSKGIHHQLSIPYTPQQNGISERLNRTLIGMIKCMIYERGLSLNLWGEVAATACYIYNRLVHSFTGTTPFKRWEGRAPSVAHLRIVGSKVFALKPRVLRGKLEENATQGTLLGYCDRQKGYRVMEKGNQNFIMSRSLTFDEKETQQLADDIKNPSGETGIELVFPFMKDCPELNNEVTSSNLRRSVRPNFGTRPPRLQDYV